MLALAKPTGLPALPGANILRVTLFIKYAITEL